MKTASLSRWGRALVLAVVCTAGAVGVADAADLRVMKTGLGEGTIMSTSGINCGNGGTDCNEPGLTGPVTLTVSVGAGARFTSWGGDCAAVVVVPPATPACTVDMTSLRSVRAHFVPATPIPEITDFSPGGIRAYLLANASVDTAAEFVAALPQEFRENWILMPRSESLQTGTAKYPRVLLISADATRVFTIALATDPSYPAAHPNAIEYMQYVAGTDKNFHFHEIVLATIPPLGDVISAGPPEVRRFPQRERLPNPVTEDDPRCFNCHSTRNVKHNGGTPGTTGVPPVVVKYKTRPNWDTYDSWGGMLAFNRDRIYRGTVEAAMFRNMFNLWTWQDNGSVRAVIEQLVLQPEGVLTEDRIVRWDTPPLAGGENDGHIQFAFDATEPVTQEPAPVGTGPTIAYSFDRRAGTGGSTVARDTSVDYVTLRHPCQPRESSGEGRAVEFFDRLSTGRPGGEPVTRACPAAPAGPIPIPNVDRIADELVSHQYATGSVPIDVRPIALAINRGCFPISGGTGIASTQTITLAPAAAAFFDARNGLTFDQVYDDTRRRAQSLTRRKADIANRTFHRDGDHYIYYNPAPTGTSVPVVNGLIREYGADTSGITGGTGGGDLSLNRLRQEVFRRPLGPGHADETVMGGFYVDREDDSTTGSNSDNTGPVALYRYFLEPLGISVDKWSMGVRGRSRTYTFADIFFSYTSTLERELSASLGFPTTPACTVIMPLVDAQLARLPAATATPTYTDMQRIFNKACIECHGGLGYPPYHTYGTSFDLTENENPPAGQRRLWRSLEAVRRRTGVPACPPSTPTCTLGTGTDPFTSGIFRRISDGGLLQHPYNPAEPYNVSNPDDPADPDVADERCPRGLMPCEGPPLSKTDIETIRRWILGGHPNTEGDPHIETVDGVRYDFQSAGEFVLLRSEGMELQARQTAVTTAAPIGPDAHTGLTSCVSINTAVAIRVGLNRVTYQPELGDAAGDVTHSRAKVAGQTRRLRLRVDGKDIDLGSDGYTLSSGGRIVRTSVPDGIEIHVPGGEGIVITPGWWDYYQVWYLNIGVRHARSTEGVMGAIAPGNWLPALSNGELIGARAPDLAQRHRDLYETFAKSWRVDDKTSLFDYEPGLTSQSFVVENWPVSNAQACVAPPQPGGPVDRPPPAPIARAEAERLCQGIVEPARRENCIADVMATGDAGFAKTYGATDTLERRIMPGPPALVSPRDHAQVSAKGIQFTWAPRPGTEKIDVVYRHCIWNGDEVFDFDRCVVLPGGTASGGSLIGKLKKHFWLVLVILLVLLLLLALFLIARYRTKGLLFVVVLAALVALLLLLISRHRLVGRSPTTYVADVMAGKEYSWKVVTETRDGVVVESETYRIEVTP